MAKDHRLCTERQTETLKLEADPYTLQQDRKLELNTTCLPFMAPAVKPTTNGKLQTIAVARSYLSARWAGKEEMP